MIKRYLTCCLVILFSVANVEASQCTYQDKDLTDSLSKLDNVISVASEKQVPHPTTEKALKHVVIFKGGDVAIIEQKNCVIFNLSINMLASEDTSEEVIVKRLSDLIQVTPVISKYFENTNFNNDINTNIKKGNFNLTQNNVFELNLTDEIPGGNVETEMAFVYTPNSSMYALYSRSIAFYLGAGMHN
ncbi:MAG: hypothetical protein KBT75_07880 [Oleispira antarctica]|nr:hypothetical protein [Oleispira antarctica]MBQ0793065.1 hypothetical protein [Oleispira antarctica]